ncbi:MAG TPA: hypothetical protein VFG88_10580 [Nocardioidaceae bacterium]|nr:hypothetical protein [Nocardioidaceae bacterium]
MPNVTIESNLTAGAAQTVLAEALGWQPGVSQAGRLGVEVAVEVGTDGQGAETALAMYRALSAAGEALLSGGPLLDSEGVAALLGVKRESVTRMKARGDLPEPDETFGRSPVWRAATIIEWQAQRPGRTGRPRKV